MGVSTFGVAIQPISYGTISRQLVIRARGRRVAPADALAAVVLLPGLALLEAGRRGLAVGLRAVRGVGAAEVDPSQRSPAKVERRPCGPNLTPLSFGH